MIEFIMKYIIQANYERVRAIFFFCIIALFINIYFVNTASSQSIPPTICGIGSGCLTPAAGSVWVLFGDSITDAHLSSSYFESYFHLRYPQHHIRFREIGRGGATIAEGTSGGRYDKQVYSLSPNIVSEFLGHNGVVSTSTFQNDLLDLTDNYILAKNNATPIYFGPIPTNTATGGSKNVYSNILRGIAQARGYVYTDTWNFLHPIWAANLASTTPVDLQFGADDRIHPGPAGHLTIAYAFLNQIQADGNVSVATVDAITGNVSNELYTSITNASSTATGVDFTRLDERLPMAFDDAAREAFKLMPQILDMNKYMLTVQNLAPGNYDVYIDGILSATTTADTLANGWNMSTMTQGPIYDQLKEVLGRIRDKQGLDRVTRTNIFPWKGVVSYQSAAGGFYKNGLRGESLKTALAPYVARINALDELIYVAAQPVARQFSIRKSGGTVENPPTDTAAPLVSGGTPSGELVHTSTATTISVVTNENATCKFDPTANVEYNSMVNTFESTGGISHTTALTGLTAGTNYTYNIRCIDQLNNFNSSDYVITFSVAPTPQPEGEISGPTDGLIAYYSFEGTGMQTVSDRSNAHNDLALILGISGSTATSTLTGKIGQAISVDGVDDRMVATSDFIGANSLTSCMWIKTNTFNGNNSYIVDNGVFRIYYTTSNRFAVSGGTMKVSANNAVVLNQWQHLCVTRDSAGIANIYVNGVLSGAANQTSGTPAAGTTKITLGNRIGGGRAAGVVLDDVRFYNRVLSTAEITQIYGLTQ